MTDIDSLEALLKKSHISYAILDFCQTEARIIIHPLMKKRIGIVFSAEGGKCLNVKETYLYGMDSFLIFAFGEFKVTVCFQLACRSTLNGEWVPLDRKINNHVSRIENGEALIELGKDDLLCYLLAKSVYTDKKFSDQDKGRIKECLESLDRCLLMDKLEGVFFRFSHRILEMVDEDRFDEIISALWRFAEY